jgi:hypothetical protein
MNEHADCLNINAGDVVRFVAPSNEDEANERFLVLEMRGDRVLVEAVCDMRLRPTFVYPAGDLGPA